ASSEGRCALLQAKQAAACLLYAQASAGACAALQLVQRMLSLDVNHRATMAQIAEDLIFQQLATVPRSASAEEEPLLLPPTLAIHAGQSAKQAQEKKRKTPGELQ